MEREKLVALVEGVQKGDEAAFSEMYTAFYDDLYYYIYKTVNDPELAADLTQDSFIEIMQSIGALQEPAAFITWSRQIARCGKIDTYTDLGYFVVNEENKCFAIREFELGSDVTAGQMVKSLKKSEETGDVWFSKDDVTRLEYRTTFVGESLGLFSSAYSFEIRLNGEKVITYKPCITKAAFIGKGLFPHSQKKKAKEQCRGLLVLLKETIGADLPVVEVKKFV